MQEYYLLHFQSLSGAVSLDLFFIRSSSSNRVTSWSSIFGLLKFDNCESKPNITIGISYLISSTVSGNSIWCFNQSKALNDVYLAFIHQTYGFQPGASGLAYFGTSVGNVVSVTCGARFASAVYNHVRIPQLPFCLPNSITRYIRSQLTNKNDGKGAPEMRMPHMVVGSIIVPAGLLWVTFFQSIIFELWAGSRRLAGMAGLRRQDSIGLCLSSELPFLPSVGLFIFLMVSRASCSLKAWPQSSTLGSWYFNVGISDETF